MRLRPARAARIILWTTAAISWSWVGVTTIARATPDGAAQPAVAVAAAPSGAAMPAGEPGSVLVLHLARPADPQVIVRREYVQAPAPAPQAAARPAPARQRSSGS